MNGRIRTAFFALVSIVALASWADDRDLYERLGTTLIYSNDFSNEEVNRLVAKGIASDDPAIVELTLDAIGVMARAHHHWDVDGKLGYSLWTEHGAHLAKAGAG